MIERFHSDAADQFVKAATSLGIPPDTSIPYEKAGNTQIEVFVKLVKWGMRASILGSGMGYKWWPFAIAYLVFQFNFRDRRPNDQGRSPYEKRFKEPFKGKDLPFGVKVFYKPGGKANADLPFAHEHTLPAIFIGWGIKTGGKWDGSYILRPLHGKHDHHIRASVTQWRKRHSSSPTI